MTGGKGVVVGGAERYFGIHRRASNLTNASASGSVALDCVGVWNGCWWDCFK